MSIVPVIKAARLIPLLVRVGFRIVRQAGSHAHLEHIADRARKVTIPIHSKPLAKKTLLSTTRGLARTDEPPIFYLVYVWRSDL
jgi:predicted RNA binding protein YcfA (HicA-like mRNA interferase family)